MVFKDDGTDYELYNTTKTIECDLSECKSWMTRVTLLTGSGWEILNISHQTKCAGDRVGRREREGKRGREGGRIRREVECEREIERGREREEEKERKSAIICL